MQLVLRYDECFGGYHLQTGDQLTDIAAQQSQAKGGYASRKFTAPSHLCRSFSLGAGLQGQFEFYGEVQPGIDRRISAAQARLLEYLLGKESQNLVPTATAIYSQAVCLATQTGIKDVFGMASALHLVVPAVNGQFRQLANEVERTLPFMRCTLTTQLALAPALTGQVALLDQARMNATVEVSKIAITSPMDVDEELQMRLKHMQAALGHLSHGDPELVTKLSLVSKQMGVVVRNIQPQIRHQLRLQERQPSFAAGMFHRISNLFNKK